jgi:hypothetical protein
MKISRRGNPASGYALRYVSPVKCVNDVLSQLVNHVLSLDTSPLKGEGYRL